MQLRTRIVSITLCMIGLALSITLYSFWKVERLSSNIRQITHAYAPVLQNISSLNGKWSTYQRFFEHYVSFKKWGESKLDLGNQKIYLRRSVEANLVELYAAIQKKPISENQFLKSEIKAIIDKFLEVSNQDPLSLVQISSLIKRKKFLKAADIYSSSRHEHQELNTMLISITRQIENHLSILEEDTEKNLQKYQKMMFGLLVIGLLASLGVFVSLRKWFLPVFEWIKIVREISTNGINENIQLPKINKNMAPEMAMLTSELYRMSRSILERESTIKKQQEKMIYLNDRLKDQNDRLIKLGSLNERILNSMPSGVLLLKGEQTNYCVEQFNSQYCTLFNIDKKNLFGISAKQALNVWPIKDVDQWLETSELLDCQKFKFEKKFFNIQIIPLESQKLRLMLFDDVTQLVEAEEKLVHLKKLVLASNMSAQVAHEVRNPLNTMSLQLEMLEEDLVLSKTYAEKDKILDRVSVISDQVHRLERITDRYLSVSLTDVQEKSIIDLHSIVDECISFLSREIQLNQIQVNIAYEAKYSKVHGNGDALYQVVLNLVRNAIESLTGVEHKTLFIKSYNLDHNLHLEVQDTGLGIAMDDPDKIFEPFITTKAEGHGLGLSVSKQICIEHGGDLKNLHSTNGALFRVSIPFSTT